MDKEKEVEMFIGLTSWKARYRCFTFFVVLAGLLVSFGLAHPISAAEPKTLLIAQGADIGIIDDQVAGGVGKLAPMHIYDFQWMKYNLVATPQDDIAEVFGNLTPGVIWAHKTIPQPDGTAIQRFYIRPGAKHHSGNPIVAEDFRYTFLRRAGVGKDSMDLSMAGLYPAKGGKLTLDESIKIIDDNTFEIRVTKALPSFSAIFQMRTYFDSKLMKANATPDDPWSLKFAAKNDAGNGPYMLEKWTEGNEMVLKRFEDFWGPRPPIDRLVFRTIPDVSNRAMLLKRGDVDVVLQLPSQELQDLKKAPGVKVLSAPSVNQLYIVMNLNVKPFDNTNLRMALTHAFPYDDVINSIYQGGAQPLYGSIATGMPGALKERRYKTDLALAKKYLEKAGYAKGLTLTMKWESLMPEHKDVGVMFMENLRKIGVELKLQQLPRGQFQKAKQDHTLDFYTCEFMGWIQTPAYLHGYHFFSTSFGNYAGWKNKLADEMILKANQEIDPGKRTELAKKIQEIIIKDPPWIFVCQPDNNIAMRSNIVGVVASYTEFPLFGLMDKK